MQAYVATGLQQANSTAGAVQEIGGHVTFLRQRVIDLALDQQQPGVLQACLGRGRAYRIAAQGSSCCAAWRSRPPA